MMSQCVCRVGGGGVLDMRVTVPERPVLVRGRGKKAEGEDRV
jgi:hypothetical protein